MAAAPSTLSSPNAALTKSSYREKFQLRRNHLPNPPPHPAPLRPHPAHRRRRIPARKFKTVPPRTRPIQPILHPQTPPRKIPRLRRRRQQPRPLGQPRLPQSHPIPRPGIRMPRKPNRHPPPQTNPQRRNRPDRQASVVVHGQAKKIFSHPLNNLQPFLLAARTPRLANSFTKGHSSQCQTPL